MFDQHSLKRFYNKRKCTSTLLQIGTKLGNSESALWDHRVLPEVTKQQLLLSVFFSHQLLEHLVQQHVKLGIGAPGPQNAPRGNETATFAKGFFQSSNVRKMLTCFTKSFSDDFSLRPKILNPSGFDILFAYV